MGRHPRSSLVLVAAALLLAACAGDGSPGGTASTGSDAEESSAVPTPADPTPADPTPADVPNSLQPRVDAARRDLADRLGASESAIDVASAEAVTWPDSSLGCPRPGMSYLQVLTEGYRIVLVHRDSSYRYHGGAGRAPFLCERPAPD